MTLRRLPVLWPHFSDEGFSPAACEATSRWSPEHRADRPSDCDHLASAGAVVVGTATRKAVLIKFAATGRSGQGLVRCWDGAMQRPVMR